MASSSPVRPVDVDVQGNRCPICQDHLMPHWRGPKVQMRMECCGVLMCMLCWKDWSKERGRVVDELIELCGRRAWNEFLEIHSKKVRARVKGEKEKQEDQQQKNKGRKGKKEEQEQKKRELEKSMERHMSCPSCRAPIPSNPEEEVVQARRKAEQGHSWAQCLVGMHYRQGRGVRKDARQAERWFRAAMTDLSVMDGGPAAAYNLGLMYAEGSHGVCKDVEEAKTLLTMAHEAGHVKATSSLGNLFEGGYGPAAGVPDHEKTITLYRQAAEAGYDVGQSNLGGAYCYGYGVGQDKEKAKAWFAKAAKQGNAAHMNYLAVVLFETEGDAAMPAIRALVRAAAEKGYADAKNSLAKYKEFILSQCASCGKPRAAMAEDPKRCNRCFAAAYCSAACQKQHWKRGGHKIACNERNKYLPSDEEDE